MKYVFYHANCIDGFTAAYCMFVHFGEAAEYLPINHGDNIKEELLIKDNEFFFVDFCPPREKLLEIESKVGSVLVLDHHKTGVENCGDLSYCKFDMNKSGAGLAYKYVWNELKKSNFFDKKAYHQGYEQLTQLVTYVQDNDLWTFALPKTKAVNAYLQLQEKTFENWERIATELWSSNRYIIVEQGEQLLKMERIIVDHHKKNSCRTTIFGHDNIPVVNISYGNHSLILNELCDEGSFSVGWSFDGTKVKYSLRSKNFDVAEIAEMFNGGGHKEAAAFISSHFPEDFKTEKSCRLISNNIHAHNFWLGR